jgi:hypothetical protein
MQIRVRLQGNSGTLAQATFFLPPALSTIWAVELVSENVAELWNRFDGFHDGVIAYIPADAVRATSSLL